VHFVILSFRVVILVVCLTVVVVFIVVAVAGVGWSNPSPRGLCEWTFRSGPRSPPAWRS
jgi:hypothetical protein